MGTFASVALADSDHELGHEPLFRDNAFLRNGRLLAAAPIGLDLRTSVPARTSIPNLDQSIQFDTLTAPEVPEPFTTIAPRQNKQRIPKQRIPKQKIPKRRIPKQRIPKQRIPKQRNDLPNDANPGAIDFSQAERTADGRLCVIKETTVDTIAKDSILECVHKNIEKCHYTYVTQFTPAQEEVCEESFEKKCQITFKQQAVTENVKKCYRPLKKVCNGQGPEQCKTIYESSCTTRYVEKQPGKYVGETECEKLPVEICGAGCTTEEGPEECHNKEISALVDIPEEVCDLNPQTTCRLTTKLVPRLKPKHECTTIPQEVCNLKFSSPRIEKKPLRSEWCLDESPVQPDEIYPERKRI